MALGAKSKNLFANVRRQLTGSTGHWFLVAGIGALLLLASLAALTDMSYAELMNDPADTKDFNPFLGIISTLGLFGWAAGAGAALVAYVVLSHFGDAPQERRFFFAAAMFTGVLLVDDAFMLHEHILPGVVGIGERYVKAAYLLLAAAFVLAFFRMIAAPNALLMLSSAVFFLMSLLFDNPVFVHRSGSEESEFALYFVEDGSKFIGIVLWSTFIIKTASDVLLKRLTERHAARHW